jgi:hypothetical protein
MPQIIVKADGAHEEERSVMLRERINVADFESDKFALNLVERLGWAVLDAAEAERGLGAAEPTLEPTQSKRRFERKPVEDRDRVPEPV